MASQNGPAIVLVAYGSVYPGAMETFARTVNLYKKEFYSSEVALAFTSGHIRRKLSEKGTAVPGPLTALADLQDRGHREIVVQPLHIVPGGEFHETAMLVRGLRGIEGRFGFGRLELGRPLLSSLDDCKKVSFALMAILNRIAVMSKGTAVRRQRNAEDEAVVLIGHGSSHPGECVYSQMAGILKQCHKNIFLGTLEGYPGIEDVMASLEESKAKRVRLVPFLLVAGGHVFRDIGGEEEGSWRRTIERRGFEAEVCLQGLGDHEEITGIFLEHTRASIETLRNEKRREKGKVNI